MITVEEVRKKTPKRVWAKIEFGEPNGCWEWQAYRTKKGYGQIMLTISPKVQKHMYAHRFIYEKTIGEFDLELKVCHSCDNPACLNPNHLWLGTYGDNNRDRQRKGRTKGLEHKGSRNGQAKLNEEKVVLIKLKLRKGENQYDIATEFGVSQAIISNINTGNYWNQVKI